MEALELDIKCFEAFDQLVEGKMMALDEDIIGDFFSISPIDLKSRGAYRTPNKHLRNLCTSRLREQARQGVCG